MNMQSLMLAAVLCLSCQQIWAELGHNEDALIIATPRVVFSGDTTYRSVHVRNITETVGYYEVYAEPARFLAVPVAAPVRLPVRDEINNAIAINKTELVTAGVNEPETTPVPSVPTVPANLLEQLVDVSMPLLVIQPDEEQIIELVVARPPGLPEGEYHSRLVFRQMPSPQAVAEAEQDEAEQLALLDAAVPADQIRDDSAVPVRVKLPEYGVAVLVREGVVSAQAQVLNPEIEEDEAGLWLTVTLQREGNRSLFGDFKVLGQHKIRSEPDVLMIRKYIPLDMPDTQSEVRMRFPAEIDLMMYHSLEVQFRERARFGGQAQASLILEL